MREDEIKQFFLMLYEDLLTFGLDKQRLTYDCGKFDLVCNITFDIEKKDDSK